MRLWVCVVAATLLAVLTSARVYVGADGQPAAFPGLHGSPVRLPIWPSGLAFTLDLRGALQPRYLGPLLTFLFVGLFDSAGTLIGLSSRAGFLDQRGELPRASRAFLSDALATSIGAVLGTSATTCYLESAAGIEEGGRTGLTAVAVAGLFLLALFLWPLCALVPGPATAPALIVVGAMMMSHAARMLFDGPTLTSGQWPFGDLAPGQSGNGARTVAANVVNWALESIDRLLVSRLAGSAALVWASAASGASSASAGPAATRPSAQPLPASSAFAATCRCAEMPPATNTTGAMAPSTMMSSHEA